jgi:hypothetical protein
MVPDEKLAIKDNEKACNTSDTQYCTNTSLQARRLKIAIRSKLKREEDLEIMKAAERMYEQ